VKSQSILLIMTNPLVLKRLLLSFMTVENSHLIFIAVLM